MASQISLRAAFPTASFLIVAAIAASFSTHVFAAPVELTPGKNGWSYELTKDYLYECPLHEAMTARAHRGDENEKAYIRCQTFYSYGQSAELSSSDENSTDPNGQWSEQLDEGKEDGHDYTCKNGEVMTGMERSGDENGHTKYRCSVVKINGEIKKMHPATQRKEKESAHLFACPTGQALIRRAHLCTGSGSACDENQDTIYQCGYVRGTD